MEDDIITLTNIKCTNRINISRHGMCDTYVYIFRKDYSVYIWCSVASSIEVGKYYNIKSKYDFATGELHKLQYIKPASEQKVQPDALDILLGLAAYS